MCHAGIGRVAVKGLSCRVVMCRAGVELEFLFGSRA